METEAPCSTWRRTSGAAPDAVKAARPVLNGGREETCRKVTRLAPTQRRGGGDQTGHLYINRTTSRPLKKGRMFPKSARRALCALRATGITRRLEVHDRCTHCGSNAGSSTSTG